MDRTKHCKECGAEFSKRYRDSMRQWDRREFCSAKCASKRAREITPVAERLMRHISIVPFSGCWIWLAAADKRGYGHINVDGRPEKAYRAAYREFVGEIPEGKVVRHRCDVPSCINPDHLELGTQKDNARDMMERGRWNPAVVKNLRSVRSFNAQQAADVRARVLMGESHTSVANSYGVDRSTVSLYVRGIR